MSSALEQAWRGLEDDPDDSSRLEVLADLLIEAGDRHGELIRVSVEARRRPLDEPLASKLRALLEAHEGALRLPGTTLSLDWIDGFVRYAQGVGGPQLTRLLQSTEARRLEWLSWKFDPSTNASTIALALKGLPRTLHTIDLQATTDEEPLGSFGNLTETLSTLPRLSTLRVHHLPVLVAPLSSPQLSSLFLRRATAFLEDLSNAKLPSLRMLNLSLDARHGRWPLRLLAAEGLPRLVSLSIEGAFLPEDLEDLAMSALLRQLEHLTVSVGAPRALEQIVQVTEDRFSHLKTFDLR
ncbi:MAG: hypothetical protein Q8L14_03545 [Myxococcales bacterium]|nr:hypothetical protein [Myxococcales bacterium]